MPWQAGVQILWRHVKLSTNINRTREITTSEMILKMESLLIPHTCSGSTRVIGIRPDINSAM